jgi:Fe-S-cluster containining protein
MRIETDLKVIKELAEKREDENWDFRSFLKGYQMDMDEMDAIVHEYYKLVVPEIDCKECGNCCREISPNMEEGDIERVEKGLKMSPSGFESQYLKEDDDVLSKDLIFNRLPYPFLEGKICTSYDYRPEACRSFPHLHKDKFVFRPMGVVQNCEICPIVFNVYEMLKRKFSWSKKHRRGRY